MPEEKKNPIADDGYDPFALREVKHPTTDLDTIIHLVKGSLGTGILAMPVAYSNLGLWAGIFGTVFVGVLCAYCIHILVKCAHTLSYRGKIPKMSYTELAEYACIDNPRWQKWGKCLRYTVSLFLVLDLLACCCIYLVVVASSLRQLSNEYFYKLDIRLWIILITIPLIFMCMVRNLKYITPFSFVANVLMLVGIIITFTYVFRGLPETSERPAIVDVEHWPLFFGTVIFAIECIGVVMALENDMRQPAHFTGCPSVLCIGLGFVIILYTLVGLFGFWKYGEDIKGNITLNLPTDDMLSVAVKLMVATAVFLTFTLQFYVPATIIWSAVREKIAEEKQTIGEYLVRVILVILCCVIAAVFPNLSPFISIVGAVCLSTLGIMLPALIEIIVDEEYPGYGILYWRLLKNILLIVFGMVGFATGLYMSILEFKDTWPPWSENK